MAADGQDLIAVALEPELHGVRIPRLADQVDTAVAPVTKDAAGCRGSGGRVVRPLGRHELGALEDTLVRGQARGIRPATDGGDREHERGDDEEEVEFQLKWSVSDVTDHDDGDQPEV